MTGGDGAPLERQASRLDPSLSKSLLGRYLALSTTAADPLPPDFSRRFVPSACSRDFREL